MEEQFYTEYFRNIANKLKAIGPKAGEKDTFFIIDDLENIRDLSDSIKRGAAETLLLLEMFDDAILDKDADNNQTMLSGAFAVMKYVSGKTGEIDRRTAKADCRNLARKIKHKMKADNLSGTLQVNGIFSKLRGEGFAVGPVAGNYYGWRYTFEWQVPENITIIPGDWY